MEIEKLKPFIGTWKTTGTIKKSPFGPAGKLSATDTYEWSDRKDFVLHKAAGKMSRRRFQNSEVISFAPAKKAFAMYAFESGASTGILFGRLKGNTWIVTGPTMRFRGKFNDDHTQLNGEWHLKTKNSKWQLWMTIELNAKSGKNK